MNQHQVPSQELWGITPFRFTTPDGWSVRQTVDQLAYMSRDDEPSTNCGILWKRVSPKLELRTIAQMSHAVTRRIDPDVKVAMSRYGKLHGRLSHLRISEFRPEGSHLTGQVYTAFFGPSFGLERPIELFEIIGHVDAEREDRLDRIKEISDIIASFRLGVASLPGVVDATPSSVGRTASGLADDVVAEGA